MREAVERNHSFDTEWLTYWVNAQAASMCGKIKVKRTQEAKTDIPIKPIQLQDVVSLELLVSFNGYPESQFFDNQPDFPVRRNVKATVVYEWTLGG